MEQKQVLYAVPGRPGLLVIVTRDYEDPRKASYQVAKIWGLDDIVLEGTPALQTFNEAYQEALEDIKNYLD